MVNKLNEVIFTESAEVNLATLYNGIKFRFESGAANKFKKEVEDLLFRISMYSDLGKVYRDDIRYLILRKKTIIFYKKSDKKIVVIAIFDTRQNWMELI